MDPSKRWLWKATVLLTLVWPGEGDHFLATHMCGVWCHSNKDGHILVNVGKGCEDMNLSANESTLAIHGSFTKHCQVTKKRPVTTVTLNTTFCLHWDPLLDLLELNVSGTVHTLCPASNIIENCCHLSRSTNTDANVSYGIVNGSINGDLVQQRPQESYEFVTYKDECVSHFCEGVRHKEDELQMIEELVMKSGVSGNVNSSCIQSSVLNIDMNFQGKMINFNQSPHSAGPPPPAVYLPPSLLPQGKSKAKVVCTLHNDVKKFQDGETGDLQGAHIASKVVGISVEGEVVTNLLELVRIHFYHPNGTGAMERRCVYWDTHQDPQVRWRRDGCAADTKSDEETVCSCSHLTYFALLLEVKKRSIISHLEMLTWITSLCCAISVASCFLLILLITRNRRKIGQQSMSDHRGLVLAVLLLCLLFACTGVVANVVPQGMCVAYGAAMHCALLCTACWMAIEILHTFWLIYMVMRPFLQCWLQMLLGFGLPVLVVTIFSLTMDIYGQRQLRSSDEDARPYLMCWIKHTDKGHLAINVTQGFFAFVVCSGAVMLLLVLRQVQLRPEWKKNRATFFSIWGLSLLFGLTWGLAFVGFGVLTVTIDFLFTIINSLQGFFLLLRFLVLKRIRKQVAKSDAYSSSTGQQMLTASERG